MKKIYSVAVILLALWAPSVNAQCPGPVPSTAAAFIAPNNCFIILQFGHPNARIRVLNSSGVEITIGAPTTNNSGMGFAFYNCNETPTSAFTISATGAVCVTTAIATPASLPIKVKTFTAHAQDANSVLLRWASVFEANSYQYVIQKSLDGRTFSDIGDLKAAGHSIQTINYSFVDRDNVKGGVYYRLKLVDLDGSVDYTKIVYINNGEVMFTNFSAFPNPFRSEVQLKGVPTSEVNRKNIRIYNTMGAEVNYRVVGGNSIVIDPSLPKGVYIIRVKGQALKMFKE